MEEWGLELDSGVAKAGKDRLKRFGWLDSSRRSEKTCGGSKVVFPVTREGAFQLSVAEGFRELGGVLVSSSGLSVNPRFQSSPQHKLQNELRTLLSDNGLSSLVAEIPSRWEKVGDLVILPADSMKSEQWSSLGKSLWEAVAKCLGARKLARQAPVAPNGTRDSRTQILLGDDGLVNHRENGIIYTFDVTKCMFSSGNVTERCRMGRLNCQGEVVVDLFAGIGYFVLPFLVRGQARHVYACEWNPNALAALERNLKLNGVDERCTVVEGDNRINAPQGVADRVCLGLLPTSEGSWTVALKALKPTGGILHVHENVIDSEENKWIKYLLSSLGSIAKEQGKSEWTFLVVHVEHVKWYAPHIRHIVVDVSCTADVNAIEN